MLHRCRRRPVFAKNLRIDDDDAKVVIDDETSRVGLEQSNSLVGGNHMNA